MNPRQLCAELRIRVHGLQTIEVDSPLFLDLVASRVDRTALESYIVSGRGRKHSDASPVPDPLDSPLVRSFFQRGGLVSGGAAVRSWLYSDSPNRDVDVFFGDFASFVSAHLDAYRVSNVDVCLYRSEPWELFDLDASCVALGVDGLSWSSEFDRAFSTGVCGVRMDRIVDPVATLRRVHKYGTSYGLRFRAPEILWLAVASGAPSDVVSQALSVC